ncbi:hypothetical protein [Nocardioides baculatus]|uniref:DUF559 domain-containing protein n=1 Tax=Nocardioides baculatus TaxID=2801337 RepID=A0ABS1LBC1_9ACTN|nr:hypothetical protein [Nocardioides baculatus]MBL0748708.1 hypothetical protein [Nocardioides baculatus]
MFRIPDDFLHRPFGRLDALDAGVPARVLEGVRFRRLHKGVYVHRDHEMTWEDHVAAARLALPESARTTGTTRLRQLGFALGSEWPLHFVVEGDLHLELEGVFLHRTVKMPPNGDEAVSTEAAFVAFCAEARLIDAIKMGCVLLHKERLDLDLLDQILTEEKWRRGVVETSYVLPFLDDRCRSMTEAELLALFVFAGLPMPEVNVALEVAPGIELTPDFRFGQYQQVVEYEGGQHQDDRGQYVADIDRYALYRRHGVPYAQITKERMRSPKATVRLVHRALVDCGYDGPPPDFGKQWDDLFRPVADVVRPVRAARAVAEPHVCDVECGWTTVNGGVAGRHADERWSTHVPEPRSVAGPPLERGAGLSDRA